MKGRILFEERQSFVGTWMWYLVIGICFISIIGTGLGLYFSRDTEGIIGLSIASIVTTAVIVLLSTSKLYVRIDKDGIYYRFPPFVSSEKKLAKAIRKNYTYENTLLSENMVVGDSATDLGLEER